MIDEIENRFLQEAADNLDATIFNGDFELRDGVRMLSVLERWRRELLAQMKTHSIELMRKQGAVNVEGTETGRFVTGQPNVEEV
jgi:uncharacterized protein YciU (UPF0263 family)